MKLEYLAGDVQVEVADLPTPTYSGQVCNETWTGGYCSSSVNIVSVAITGSSTPNVIGASRIAVDVETDGIVCTPTTCSIIFGGTASSSESSVSGFASTDGITWTVSSSGPGTLSPTSSFTLQPGRVSLSFSSLNLGSSGSGAPRSGGTIEVTAIMGGAEQTIMIVSV